MKKWALRIEEVDMGHYLEDGSSHMSACTLHIKFVCNMSLHMKNNKKNKQTKKSMFTHE